MEFVEARIVGPLVRRVARAAIVRELSAMDICVTIETLGACCGKHKGCVTGDARHAFVSANEWILRHRIVRKQRVGFHLGPVVRRMTGLAVNGQRAVRRLKCRAGLRT